ncbi:MAG: SulP family inorganic anion transporter [Sulfuricurvum sp.]
MSDLRAKSGDIWGGVAAMLVAMPAAIAFGMTVYATVDRNYGGLGAMSGILGVMALGIVASIFSGTERLISAPSAPAAALLSAFALEFLSRSDTPSSILIFLFLIALFSGAIQILFGAAKVGNLIKYMPYPVVSGYLSGVGLYIISSQVPKFLGMSKDAHFWESIVQLPMWQWQSILIGSVTILVMVFASKQLKLIPITITAILSGVIVFFILGMYDSSMWIHNNPFVIGQLGEGVNVDFISMIRERFVSLTSVHSDQWLSLFFPALTLATLLSIDTLKTCIVVDSVTHSYHNPNRELIAQGVANISSACIGGMPGSGTMGPTMVNISSGAVSYKSGIVVGLSAILAFGVFAQYLQWIPVAALSAVLIVIGFRMIDFNNFQLLKSHKTILDFMIVVIVAISAVTISLIAAAGIGLALAIVLFIIQQIRTSVVYRYFPGSDISSKMVRSNEETNVLNEYRNQYSVYELQGSLFFGTANQLIAVLKNDMETRRFIILDMKRVQNVDISAAHVLLQLKDVLHEKGGYLFLSRLPHKLPTGDDLENYFHHVGLFRHLSPITVFDDLEDALEWVEKSIIKEKRLKRSDHLLNLNEFNLFEGRKDDTLKEIESVLVSRSYQKGETIYRKDDEWSALYLIRKGLVRITYPVNERKHIHLSTLGENSFFGEYSFLENLPQYTDATALTYTEVYVINRRDFDVFSQNHHNAAFWFMQNLASELAERLHKANIDLGMEYDV